MMISIKIAGVKKGELITLKTEDKKEAIDFINKAKELKK